MVYNCNSGMFFSRSILFLFLVLPPEMLYAFSLYCNIQYKPVGRVLVVLFFLFFFISSYLNSLSILCVSSSFFYCYLCFVISYSSSFSISFHFFSLAYTFLYSSFANIPIHHDSHHLFRSLSRCVLSQVHIL